MNIVRAKQFWNKFLRGYRQALPWAFIQNTFQEHDTTLNNLETLLKKSNDDLNKIISEY